MVLNLHENGRLKYLKPNRFEMIALLSLIYVTIYLSTNYVLLTHLLKILFLFFSSFLCEIKILLEGNMERTQCSRKIHVNRSQGKSV